MIKYLNKTITESSKIHYTSITTHNGKFKLCKNEPNRKYEVTNGLKCLYLGRKTISLWYLWIIKIRKFVNVREVIVQILNEITRGYHLDEIWLKIYNESESNK